MTKSRLKVTGFKMNKKWTQCWCCGDGVFDKSASSGFNGDRWLIYWSQIVAVNTEIFWTAAPCGGINQYKWATVVHSAQGGIIYIQRRYTAYQQGSPPTTQSLSAWKEALQQAAGDQVGDANCRLTPSGPVELFLFILHQFLLSSNFDSVHCEKPRSSEWSENT